MISETTTRTTGIDGLVVVTPKAVKDERGTIREMYRGSSFPDGFAVRQVNLTESVRGAVRGLHGEAMTKVVGVVAGRAFGVYLDARDGSPTRGVLETVELTLGTQVLVPAGVCNGFQALEDGCQYLYFFDAEWVPGMAGASFSPLSPALGIAWPLPVDPADRAQVSEKDVSAPEWVPA